MNKTLILALGLILTFQLNIFSQTDSPQFSKIEFDLKDLSEVGKSAFKTLLATEVFAVNGYGIADAPYPPTVALLTLLAERNAEKALQSLIRNARPEGQAYGLLGLQIIKSKQFKTDLKAFKSMCSEDENQKIELNSMSEGCAQASVKLKRADVINDFKKGSFAKRIRFRFGHLK